MNPICQKCECYINMPIEGKWEFFCLRSCKERIEEIKKDLQSPAVQTYFVLRNINFPGRKPMLVSFNYHPSDGTNEFFMLSRYEQDLIYDDCLYKTERCILESKEIHPNDISV